MIGRTLFAGITLALSLWASSHGLAFEGEFLSSEKLQEAYRRLCPANMSELKTLLRTKKIKVQGTNKLVVEVYSELLRCDYQTDDFYTSFEDPITIKRIDDLIRKRGGKERYIEFETARNARIKTGMFSDPVGSYEELDLFIFIAKLNASVEAVVLVLRSQAD